MNEGSCIIACRLLQEALWCKHAISLWWPVSMLAFHVSWEEWGARRMFNLGMALIHFCSYWLCECDSWKGKYNKMRDLGICSFSESSSLGFLIVWWSRRTFFFLFLIFLFMIFFFFIIWSLDRIYCTTADFWTAIWVININCMIVLLRHTKYNTLNSPTYHFI